ncbi:uncharacterized protein TNCV_1768021 [Trichonephila clavipes]|nr:uncharacterized protein TNCV_1768021 [Trichonephila clavipes]
MITNFFIPELNNHDVQELWFQQDGATCHTARATIDLLKDTFSDHLISRFGPVNWPPRSCDLTPPDYFLWGYVKSLVYAEKPQTLDHLEDNIRRVIADIRPQMLEKVIENWTSRLDYIRASRGSPMLEIIFKMRSRDLEKFLKFLNAWFAHTTTAVATSLTVIEVCSLRTIILENFFGVIPIFEQAKPRGRCAKANSSPSTPEDPMCRGGPLHLKSVEAQSSLVCVIWKLKEWDVNPDVVQVTCPWFEITRSVVNDSHVALQGNVT